MCYRFDEKISTHKDRSCEVQLYSNELLPYDTVSEIPANDSQAAGPNYTQMYFDLTLHIAWCFQQGGSLKPILEDMRKLLWINQY